MKKILANNEVFQIQSGTGGILKAPNVVSGEQTIGVKEHIDSVKEQVDIHDARNLRDLSKVYDTWEEPLVGDGNRASNHYLIHFKTNVFGVSGNCVIRQFAIRTSDTETASNATVYAKLFLESDTSVSLATSRPVKITAQNTYFTFTFDQDVIL